MKETAKKPRLPRRRSKPAGLPPGTLMYVGERKVETVRITYIDYDEHNFDEKQVSNIVFTDRFSNKSVLTICGPLFILSILAWTFTTMPEKYFLTIPLLILIHMVMGLSSAGVSLASGNIGMKLAPEGQATTYLATNTIVNSIAAGIAPILGGKFADFFLGRELEWTLKYTSPTGQFSLPTLSLQQWDFFFAMAFVIGLYSLHRLAMVKEAGEVEEKIVAQELVAEMRSQVRILSSIEGLRQMVSFPFSIVRNMTAKISANNHNKAK